LKNRTKNRVNRLILFVIVCLFAQSCNKGDDTQTEKVIDIDGNVYHTVTIGTQVWMAENLKVTRYRNGDRIGTTSLDTLDISGEVNPKYQWAYDGDQNNANSYGRLYTWYSVNDSRNICPAGWHIPTDFEWTIMENYLITNGYNYDGTFTSNKCAISLAATSGWYLGTIEGSVGNTDYPDKRNTTGFTSFPSGLRSCDGRFEGLYFGSIWWSSTPDTLFPVARILMLDWNSSSIGRAGGLMKYGFSVRCIQD